MTNKEKAEFIIQNKYSKRAKTTLERLTADELDWIIENKRDPEADEFNQTDNEAIKELANSLINFLDDFKKARTKDEKGINPALKTFILKNTDKISKFTNAKITGILGVILLIMAIVVLIVDSLVGFDLVKRLLGIKNEPKNESNKHNPS